jgi:hypothetical protein
LPLKARQEFAEGIGEERMEEMWKVREDLAKLRKRMIAKLEADGLMEPSALLAEAMVGKGLILMLIGFD